MKIYDLEGTSRKIFELSEKKGWTDAKLSEQMGLTPQAISKWRKCKNSPTVDALVLMSGIFGVSLDELIDNYEIEL